MNDSEILDRIRNLILDWCLDEDDPRPPGTILGDVMTLLGEREAERAISAGLILDIVHGPPRTDDQSCCLVIPAAVSQPAMAWRAAYTMARA